jgi:hypothetical protein
MMKLAAGKPNIVFAGKATSVVFFGSPEPHDFNLFWYRNYENRCSDLIFAKTLTTCQAVAVSNLLEFLWNLNILSLK